MSDVLSINFIVIRNADGYFWRTANRDFDGYHGAFETEEAAKQDAKNYFDWFMQKIIDRPYKV